MRLTVLAGAVVSTSLLGAGVGGVALLGPDAGRQEPDAPLARVRSAPNATGLAFVENRGQVDRRARFYLQGPGASVFFTPKGLAMSLVDGRRAGDRWSLRLDFLGARGPARPSPLERLSTVVSSFQGRQDRWRTRIPAYSGLAYRELWPGIDLVYGSRGGRLKYTFIVKPGADAGAIRLGWRGAHRLAVNGRGQLVVSTPARRLIDDAPSAYQVIGGRRRGVAAEFDLAGRSYGFRVAEHDRNRPLIIDPAVLVSAGYLGGARDEAANNVALGPGGDLYVTGATGSEDYPTRVGPDRDFNGGVDDAFVARVSADGSRLVWATYVGGSDRETGIDIAVDRVGNAYVTGSTSSTDFPVVGGPDAGYNGGQQDAFVTKISADGSRLEYSGYIGGSATSPPIVPNNEQGNGIAVDRTGSAYVAGFTPSSAADGFPATPGSFDPTANGFIDTFLVKVKADGSGFDYGGFIGGPGADPGTGLTIDAEGNAYVNGFTGSDQTAFPDGDGFGSLPGFDRTYNGPPGPVPGDAFVAKVNPAGSALLYATYLGGAGVEQPFVNAVDRRGNLYLTGYTTSTQRTFPVRRGPDLTYNGGSREAPGGDVFVAKLDPSGRRLRYAGYLGGSRDDTAVGIEVDRAGRAYVAGTTASRNFPARGGPDSTYNGGREDAFIARIVADGSRVDYAGFIGGSLRDGAIGVAVDAAGDAHVAGSTESRQASFPVAVGPDVTFNGRFGDTDAFVARVSTRTCFGRPVTRAGGPGNDALRGTRGVDVIAGHGGDDRIAGLGGGDRLCGGAGRDSVSGGDGADALDGGGGRDRCAGGGGRDRARGCERRTGTP